MGGKGEGDRVGLCLFDERGSGYGSPGFCGAYGEQRNELYVAAERASEGCLPGRIEPGVWTVVVPIFHAAAAPARVRATVTLSFGGQGEWHRPGPEVGVIDPALGWYRGDLHCHTPESSDAWRSGTALTPRGWADTARRIGLDFVSLTDHNAVSQNLDLAAEAGHGVLLLAGEEMTNWFYGHATVTGIRPGEWLDWRQRPAGTPLGPDEGRIRDFLDEARRLGAYVSAAPPAPAACRGSSCPTPTRTPQPGRTRSRCGTARGAGRTRRR